MTKPIMIDMRDRCCGTVTGLWQYDYGRVLKIQDDGMPTAVEIHFSLQENGGNAVTRVGTTRDGVTEVVIPDSMLENEVIEETGYQIHAFIYLADNTSGQTTKKIDMLVRTRPRPEAFDTPEEAELFRETIVAVNEAADRAEAAENAAAGHAQAVEQSAAAAADSATKSAGYAGDAAGYAGMAKKSAEDAALSEGVAEGQAIAAKGSADAAASSEVIADGHAKAAALSADAANKAQAGAQTSADAAAKTLADTKTEGAKIVSDATMQASNAMKDAQAAAQSAAEADTDQKQVAQDKTTVEQLAKQVQELTAQVQTLTAKAEEYAEAAKRNEQADLAVNDPADPAYVKNRTHYVGEEEMLPDINVVFNDPTSLHYFPALIGFTPGETYTITWDGTPYTVKAITAVVQGAPMIGVGNMVFAGGENNGLPFGIVDIPVTNMSAVGSLTAGTHTFRVGREKVHKIDPKYYERLAWTDPGNITNTLEWDGDITGKYAVELQIGNNPTAHYYIANISDQVLTMEQLDGATLTYIDYNGESVEVTLVAGENLKDMAADNDGAKGCYINPDSLVSMHFMQESYTHGGFTLPVGISTSIVTSDIEGEPAQGYLSSLTGDKLQFGSPGEIHKLDPKYYERLAWDESVLLLDTVLDIGSDNATNIVGSMGIVSGEKYTVVWDGVSYECEAMDANFGGVDGIGIGNFGMIGLENTGEPFLIGDAPSFGIIAAMGATGSHTVCVKALGVHKIDNKFIDAEWMATGPQMISGEAILTDLTATTSTNAEASGLAVANVIHGGSFSPVVGENYIVVFDGKDYAVSVQSIDIGGGYVFTIMGNESMIDSAKDNTGEPFVMLFGLSDQFNVATKTENTYTISIYAAGRSYNPLPVEYLPVDYINSLIDAKLGVIENGAY